LLEILIVFALFGGMILEHFLNEYYGSDGRFLIWKIPEKWEKEA